MDASGSGRKNVAETSSPRRVCVAGRRRAVRASPPPRGFRVLGLRLRVLHYKGFRV